MANVVVASHHLTDLKIVLYVAGVSAMVDVSSDVSPVDQTSNTTLSTITRKNAGLNISFPYKEQNSTPRVREYFPETLVWLPELVTDKKGKAEMSFKMADSITTWKMFASCFDKKGEGRRCRKRSHGVSAVLCPSRSAEVFDCGRRDPFAYTGA